MLNRTGDVRTSIIADYDIGGITSRRSRLPRDQQILEEHHEDVRVMELVGAHSFATIDYASRRLAEKPAPLLILDFRRAASITTAGGLLLADILRQLTAGSARVILAGIESNSPVWSAVHPLIGDIPGVRSFTLLDQAIEWAEDQIIFRYGGYLTSKNTSHLKEQPLLSGLTDEELSALSALSMPRRYKTGQRIVTAYEPATSLFFLQSGIVSVKLPSGVRLASLDQGMEFGEMSLLEERRTADVFADTNVECLELPIEEFDRFRREHPHIGERIARNLAAILAKRLILANTKIDVLASY
jgi:glutaminase